MSIVRLLKPTQSCVFFFRFWLQYSLKSPTFQALKAACHILRFLAEVSTNPPSPWESESGRFCGVLVPTTSGETLIDFMVNGESILGSPCLGGGWWRLVEVGWWMRGVGTSWLVIYRVGVCLLVVWMDFVYFFGVNCCFLFWFCFFWNLSHIVGHEFLCVFVLKHACTTKAFERPTVTVLDDTPAWWP